MPSPEELDARMAAKSDDELVSMLTRSEDWTLEALDAARAELEKRNIDTSGVDAMIAAEKAAIPLANRPFAYAEIVAVAKWQKAIIWMILISLAAMLIPGATLVAGLIQIFFIYRLAVAVRSKLTWVYVILAFIPLIGLLGLLHLNERATKTLKTNGVRVGLMGAKNEDIVRLSPDQMIIPLRQ